MYRPVNIEDTQQECDIFIWQGMDAKQARIASRRNAIDRWWKDEKRIELSDMDTFSAGESSILDDLHNKVEARKALDCLSNRQRQIIMEKFYTGYTFQEIGKHLDITESGAWRIYETALKQMRRRMGLKEDK